MDRLRAVYGLSGELAAQCGFFFFFFFCCGLVGVVARVRVAATLLTYFAVQ
jgi:hypothetical protein